VTIVGRSVAPFLGGFLISAASFQSVYVACAVSGVLALLVGAMLPREAGGTSGTTTRFPKFVPALKTILQNPTIVYTSLVEAAQFLVFGAVEAFLALYAASLGVPAWQVGIILGAQLVSVVAVKPLMGTLSDRWGRRAIIFPGLALGVVAVGLLPAATEVVGLTLLSLAFGVAFATVTSSTSALVADVAKQGQFGASIGVLRTIMDVGQTIGPVLTGFLVGVWGYGLAFPALAAVLALSAVLFALAPRAAIGSAAKGEII
jgi:MFS family permease